MISNEFLEIVKARNPLIHLKSSHWIKMSGAGSNATVLQDFTIGDNAILGVGAVVTKDVPANTVAGEVPAKFVKFIL